jgi:crotonobetaine/carnitine-CoA ligase
MARFMVPRYLEFRDALPKTETHRVKKSLLKRTGVGPETYDRGARPS